MSAALGELVLVMARAIACQSAPDKAQLWEAQAALNALCAYLKITPADLLDLARD